MMICTNGKTHTHETVLESKICYGLIQPPAPAVRPHEMHRTWRDEPISVRQLRYIVDILGGDELAARCMNQGAASTYIDSLKRGGKSVSPEPEPVPVALPWSPPAPARKPVDPRLEMVKSLISGVPDGYYATQVEEGAKINFVRLSHPKHNKFAGALKIQTQHAETLETEAVLWPSGSWSVFRSGIVDILLLLVTDYRTAAVRYGAESKRCTRCNISLTDGYSLHYGIGPICDKVWPWVIDIVDDSNDGKNYDQLVREGSPVVSRRV